MTASSARRPLLLVGVASLSTLVMCLGGIGRGAPPIPRAPAGGNPVRGLANRYHLATQCGKCHKPENREEYEQGRNNKEQPLIKYEEFPTWQNRDKHSYAYQALSTRRGEDMGRLLQTDVTKDAACLNCHAPGYRATTDPALQERAKAEGVSCYVCHGSFENDTWVNAHPDPLQQWRKKTMDDKEKQFGLLAVRNPIQRSELCLSCHVGNAEDGKVLTHDMYAAGHPPLPGFEASTFSLAEPPHWWPPRQVPHFKNVSAKELRENFHADLSGSHDTKLVLLGAVVALRESMELMAKQAAAAPAANGWPAWPEFAHFECYSCHHDLRSPGYRQRRGYAHRLNGVSIPGPAGRPQFRLWSTALVPMAIHQAGGGQAVQDEFTELMKALYATSDVQPFGTAGSVAAAAGELAKWADGLATKLDATPLSPAAVPGLLRTLASHHVDTDPDFDTAREIAWAIDRIYSEWNPRPPDDAIRQLLQSWREQLKLDPFSRRDKWPDAGKTADPAKDRQQLSKDELDEYLGQVAAYSPTTFRASLQQFLKALPPAR